MATKVLVFESDAAFAAELRGELSKLGCTTSIVDDGNAGLQQASADKPDLILLSIELPRMNGFSVCNKLKKDGKLKDVPLIIMSTESSDETFEQHRKLRTRAEDYVHKPIAFGELLEHINQFVKLASSGEPAGEGIVIDDEIAIGSIDLEEEGTLIIEDEALAAGKLASTPPKRTPSEAPKMQGVDEDIDAFIEGGFGKAMSSPQNGATTEVAPPVKPKNKSAAPPPLPTGPDPRIAELEAQLQKEREDAANLRADFDSRIEAEQKKMDAEMEELRAKVASTASKGGVSSREFLDLREALNKKDKEILALKEQLGKKDKEMIEVRDKALAFERTKADVDDKILAVERELEESREKLDALGRDKDQAKKASEDFKNRLAKAQSELETRIADSNETKAKLTTLQGDLDTRTRELEEVRVKAAEDGASHEAAAAAARADYESAIAKERAEKAAAIEVVAAEKAAALDALEKKALSDLAEAIAVRETELKAESDSRLGALHRAHQDETGKIRAEHTQEKETLATEHAANLATEQAQHDEEVEAMKVVAAKALATREAELEAKRESDLQDAEAKRVAEVSAIEKDRDEKVAALEKDRDDKVAAAENERDEKVAAALRDGAEKVAEVEKDRDDKVATSEKRRSDEVAAAERDRDQRVADIERQRDEAVGSLKSELAQVTESKDAEITKGVARIADLDEIITDLSTAKGQLERDLATAKDRVVVLEAETAALRMELSEARAAHGRESSRADKAFAKWEADRAALERAKDALAVVLGQIEDAEGRSIT